MAGEMLASAVVKEVVTKLGSAVWEEIGLIWRFKEKLEALKSTFSVLEAVLQDAQRRSIKDRSLCDWLKKLKHAAYDIEKLMDEIQAEIPQKGPEARDGMAKKVGRFFSSSNPIITRDDMGRKIKKIMERLDQIAAERIKFHLKEETVSDQLVEIRKRETFSEISENTVLGRDEDRENIMRMLLEETDEEEISVIPIVGLAGIGKTTLAKLVFNDERANRGHFDLCVWVYVSISFDLKRIAGSIISATEGKCDGHSLESMRNCLKEKLRGKRYLFVLDDMWSESIDEWDNLKLMLRGGSTGSKIIVTTRSEKVASITGSVTPYHLKGLSDDHCWDLFSLKAFGKENKVQDPRLVSIGEEIAKKCGGVPLAANAIGGTLRFKTGISAWSDVRDSGIWKLDHNENGVLSSLMLSYDLFPSRVKQCFAYCSVFPKGYVIDKDKLILQWISQGFIQLKNSSLSEAKEIGDEYIQNLLWPSFLQDLRRHEKTGRFVCNMHDLVHDLAQSIIGDELCIMTADKETKISKECRHASLVGCTEPSEIPTLFLENVRTLHFRGCGLMELPPDIFLQTKCLRTLDISSCWIEELPHSVGKLKYLRYLDASNIPLERIPGTFGNLQNLLSLNLSCCAFRTLPDGIGNLLKLQALNLSGCSNLQTLPKSIGDLLELQTLHLSRCDNLWFLPTSIGNLSKLQNIDLSDCCYLWSLPESIGNLLKLQSIYLSGCNNLTLLPESIGNLLELHSIYLSGCYNSLPESISNLLKLQTLNLSCCGNLQSLPELIGDLLELQDLVLSQCLSLQSLPESIGNLLKLSALDLSGCENLKSLPESIGNLLKVEVIKLSRCKNLQSLPESIGNLLELHSIYLSGCYKLNSLPESISNLLKLQTLDLSCCGNLQSLPELIGDLLELQDLVLFKCLSLQSLPESIGNLLKLSALDLSECENLKSLPESIGNLLRVEVIKLSCCKNLQSLPESIGKLLKLQWLDLFGCKELQILPLSICSLLNLELLNISGCKNLRDVPNSIYSMINLKYFIIRGHNVSGDKSLYPAFIEFKREFLSIEDLQRHNLASNELEIIVHIERIWNVFDAKRANLREKHNVRSLTLSYSKYPSDEELWRKRLFGEVLLEYLLPHPNLEVLEVERAYEIPQWMVNKIESWLPNLVKLRLSSVRGCSHIPPFGKLTSLEVQQIEEMDALRL